MQPQQSGNDILGPKALNYEFLTLVREQNYADALRLGRKILQSDPNNPSVLKFCQFIQQNNQQLAKMVQQQQQYQYYDDQQQGQEQQSQQSQQEDKQKQKQKQSEEDQQNQDQQDDEQEQQEEIPQNKKQKIQLTTCTLNQIPHICPRHHKKIITEIVNAKINQNNQKK